MTIVRKGRFAHTNRSVNVIGEQTQVLHVIGRLIPGGVETRTLELIKELDDLAIDHHVWLTSGQKGNLDVEYRRAGASLAYGAFKSLAFPGRFVSYLRRNDVDVVHSNISYSSGPVLALAWVAGVPRRVVQFQSDGVPWKDLSRQKRIQYSVSKSLIRLFATDVTGLTPGGLDIIWGPRWRKNPKFRVVSNGIRLSTPTDELVRPTPIKAIGPGTSVVLHIGRGDLATKRRDRALEIFAALHKSRPDSVLVFVGRDGKTVSDAARNRASLENYASALGITDAVVFAGETNAVANYLAHGDILLFTSTLEGLPGVVLEALAAGLPVVATPLPGTKYISEHLPIDLVASPDAPTADWLGLLLAHPAKNSEKSRETMRSLFDESIFEMSRALDGYIQLWSRAGHPSETL